MSVLLPSVGTTAVSATDAGAMRKRDPELKPKFRLEHAADGQRHSGVENDREAMAPPADHATDVCHVHPDAAVDPHNTELPEDLDDVADRNVCPNRRVARDHTCEILFRVDRNDVGWTHDVQAGTMSNGEAIVAQEDDRPSLGRRGGLDRHKLRRPAGFT